MSKLLPFAASPAGAYRVDMKERTAPFSPHDDVWLAVASTLHLAATTSGSERKQLVREALGAATKLLGTARITQFLDREWDAQRSSIESLLVLADLIHQRGALHLAAVILDDLIAAAPDVPVLERGRVLALRARLVRKLEQHTEAEERYRFVESLGVKHELPELEARAAIGFAALAQVRGNLPDLRAQATRAAILAERHGLSTVERLAQQGMTYVAGMSGDLARALVAGWRVLALSRGNAVLEAEALQNLGQAMLVCGRADLARVAFAAVMRRAAPAHIVLPALGGLALASARTQREATVEWSVQEVWRLQKTGLLQYEVASALLECSIALRLLGRTDDAERFSAAAEKIARARGFHEIAFRASEPVAPTSPPQPSTLSSEASAIVSELEVQEPERLPTHVQLEVAHT